MPLPNLFVIGAPKCGTTSLHRYLAQHPAIAMSAVKEPKYFLAEGVRPHHRGPGDERACRAYVVDRHAYEALFTYPPGTPSYAGESSPYYLWDTAAAARIRALVPEARLVAVLREPAMRAYSNWADLREQGREKLDFASALAAEEERRRLDWEPFWRYRELGLYGAQLTALFEVFPPEQVKVLLAEELTVHPDAVVGEVFDFLDLERLPHPLDDVRLNQTMYTPVDRKSRALEALLEHGQRARPLVPRALRRTAREAVRRRLRSQATTGTHGGRLRHDYGDLFAADRALLEGLGLDVARWDSPERTDA
ncbi:MAG TPA: sulfotransferase [Acidimicrobiales bacterium]|nr:sulfotransferase [Acidimicrobiales bacterium]